MANKYNSFMAASHEDKYCNVCKGSCYTADNATRQHTANKIFGITPNNCIPASNGDVLCPYKK